MFNDTPTRKTDRLLGIRKKKTQNKNKKQTHLCFRSKLYFKISTNTMIIIIKIAQEEEEECDSGGMGCVCVCVWGGGGVKPRTVNAASPPAAKPTKGRSFFHRVIFSEEIFLRAAGHKRKGTSLS